MYIKLRNSTVLVDSIATVIYLYTHISIYIHIHQYTYTWSTSIYIPQDLRWIISSFLFSHPQTKHLQVFPVCSNRDFRSHYCCLTMMGWMTIPPFIPLNLIMTLIWTLASSPSLDLVVKTPVSFRFKTYFAIIIGSKDMICETTHVSSDFRSETYPWSRWIWWTSWERSSQPQCWCHMDSSWGPPPERLPASLRFLGAEDTRKSLRVFRCL